MAERLHPGVYVEEVSGGVRPIEGVSTSTAAFIGECGRGIPALAQFVTSFAEFERAFGGFAPGDAGLLASAVDGFFAAGGRRAYVVRVLPKNAVKGLSDPLPWRAESGDQDVLQFAARGAGKWADALRINISPSTNFPREAFTVDILWSEQGAPKRVESYADVRMDPESEDYVIERMKSSRYVVPVDLWAAAVLAGTASLAASAPVLEAEPPPAGGYVVSEGKQITATWWNANDPDSEPTKDTVTLDKASIEGLAGSPKVVSGTAKLTAKQLGTLLQKLTKFNVTVPSDDSTGPAIAIKVGVAPVVSLDTGGAAATFNLPAGFTAKINGIDTVVAAFGADPTKVTRDELIGKLTGLGLTAAAGTGNTITVTGRGNEKAAPTLAFTAGTGGTLASTTKTAGTQGVGPEHYDGLRISLTEVNTVKNPPMLRAIGIPGAGRGYGASSAQNPDVRPAEATNIRVPNGSDGSGSLGATDYEGDERERTGLHAFDGVDVNIVAIPGKNDVSYLAVGMAYCDGRGDCFFLADGPGGSDRQIEVKPDDAKQFVESLPSRSKNSAMFYPWIQVPDPVGVGRNPTRFVPPSGHVAGIFARTDVTRGVWKAPAGIEASVPEAVGLQYQVIDAEQDLLNPVSLNCLRQFPNVGIVSWGTRTLSADPEWRYVPVRRMGLFLMESLRRGLQWAVFEPNDAELWGRITINIKSFMMTLFRQGAFQGATPDQAFSVVCDASTNPQENIDAGIVTASVAFAPLKPAEFVVIQVQQKSLLVS